MMFPLLRLLVCEVFGHRWGTPHPLGTQLGPLALYQTSCRRCHLWTEGDWYAMEAVGAWQHHRSIR